MGPHPGHASMSQVSRRNWARVVLWVWRKLCAIQICALGWRLVSGENPREDGLVMLKISSGICRCFLMHLSWGFLMGILTQNSSWALFFFGGGSSWNKKSPWPTAVQPLRCCQEFPEVCRAAGGKIVDFLRVNLGIFKRHVSCSVICIYTLAKYNYRLYHMHKCRHILTYTYWDTLWYIVCNILIDSHGNGSYRLVTWAIFVFTPRNEYGTQKSPVWKGKSSSKPLWLCFMLIFRGVFLQASISWKAFLSSAGWLCVLLRLLLRVLSPVSTTAAG